MASESAFDEHDPAPFFGSAEALDLNVTLESGSRRIRFGQVVRWGRLRYLDASHAR